jgi:carbamoyl-phosphate synthase large subunit
MKDITVLMTGAGAPGAPGILSCYRNNGERNIRVIGVDIKKRVPTINMLDVFENVPPANDQYFINRILELAIKHKVDVVQPLVTKELEIFSENISKFNELGIKVCVAPIENLKIANDKGLLIEELSRANIAVPKYKIITESNQFCSACTELGFPKKTICFKPTKSNGSRGFRVIDNSKDRGALLFNEKPNSTYIRFEEAQEILSSLSKIPELLIMEYLPGKEYSIDMLVENGVTKYCIPRLRTAMNGGISTRLEIEKNEDVIDYCCKVANHLRLNGNIGIQVRYSSDGKVKILEINPRVQGTIVACGAAGVNLPYLAIKQYLGEQIPDIKIKWNIEMIRYWNEVYFDESGFAFTF